MAGEPGPHRTDDLDILELRVLEMAEKVLGEPLFLVELHGHGWITWIS